MEDDIFNYKCAAESMNQELESMIEVNDLQRESINNLIRIIGIKDKLIEEQLTTIGRLTVGGREEIKGLKEMFFSKNAKLFSRIEEQTKFIE